MIQKKNIISSAVVVVPPIQDFYFTYHRFSALGANIVYEIVRKYFQSSELFNFPVAGKKTLSARLPAELSYLKEYLIDNETGSLSFFTRYKHFGPSIDDCVSMVINTNANLCLISCFAFCYAQETLRFAEKLASANKDMIIIAGGAGVCSCPQYFLHSDAINYAVTGEAEISLPQLIEFVAFGKGDRSEIPNLYWKENGSTEKSEKKSFTSAQQIKPCLVKTYENKTTVFLSTTLSRGCPFVCQFCSNHLSQGKEFRTITSGSSEVMIEQVLSLCNHTGKEININFEDDNVLLDYEFLKNTIIKCKEKTDKLKITFENGIDYRLLTPARCKELIGFGVCQFNFSIATTDRQISDKENRFSHFERLDSLYSILNEYNVPAITYFICGFPNDTHLTIVNNLIYLLQRPTRSGISLFYAVPGMESYTNTTVMENLDFPCRFAGSSAYPWNSSLSTETLITAFRLSRLVNIMKSEHKTDDDNLLIKTIMAEKKLYTMIKSNGNASVMRDVPRQDHELVRLFINSIV